MKKYKIKDVCTILNGRAYKYDELQKDGKYRILRVGNFFSKEDWYYSDMELDDNKYCLNGDLLYAWSANFGPKIWEGDKTIFHYHIWKIIPNEKVDKMYLYYKLYSITDELKSNTHGSVMLHLTKSDMENFEIELPDINDQIKIAKILYDIDRKIDNNNKINNNLFELLKCEFKNKFYEKADKNSHLIDYISEMIGGDWGKEKPEGNSTKRVYCVRGADIPNMEYGNKGNAPVRFILEKNYINKKLDPNNIIVEISGGSPTQSTGRTAYITRSILNMYDSPLLCTNFCRAIETSNKYYAPFVYMYLKLMYDDGIFFNWENGTTGIKNLALNDMLSNIEVKSPDEEELKKYYKLFDSLMNKISFNSNENMTLEKLKKIILPKLMNMEINLSNV